MRVFVSSTYSDLVDVRARLIEALQKRGDWPVAMEVFGARPELPVKVCLEELRRSHVVILLVGCKYGSIEPESGLSFTHREFREAMACGIPVLALVLKNGRAATPAADEQAAAFRKEVEASGILVDHVNEPVKLPEMAMAALGQFLDARANRLGQFKTFQEAEDYFATFLNADSIFNHTHPLVGRDDILTKLEQFMDGDGFAAVLPGAGGSGKSKLLLELARKRKNREPRLLFLGPEFALAEERLRELPSGSVCIAVEDAHRQDNLAGLVQTIAGAASQRSLKLLLTCRPSGLPQVKYALRSVPENKLLLLDELPDLDRDTDAVVLARNSLGGDYSHLAEQLVAVSDGNPLIITVGGNLIRDKRIAPGLLAQQERFRTAALNGLLQDLDWVERLADDISAGKLLAVLAAICPIRLGPEDAEERLADFFDVGKSAIVRAISALDTKHHLILRLGRRIRLKPDVLADHILFQASVADGEPTGFVDELVEAFSPTYLKNILTNAAELEWRCKASGSSVDVLANVYNDIRNRLPNMTHRERSLLLEALEGAALFVPKKTWSLVNWLLERPDAPPEQEPFRSISTYSHTRVVQRIPPLLARIAVHEEFTPQCAAKLWELAQQDDREPNPYPDHPLRVLRDLVGYRMGRPFRLQLAALRGLEAAIARERRAGGEPEVADTVLAALAREVEWQESRGFTLSLGAGPLHSYLGHPDVRGIRTCALKMLEQQARSSVPKIAIKAVEAYGHLLSPPRASFGRQVTEPECEAWLPEAKSCVEALVDIANTTASDVVSLRVWLLLRKRKTRGYWAELLPSLEAGLERVRRLENLELYLSLLHSWFVHGVADGHREVERHHSELRSSVAKRLIAKCDTAEAIIERIGSATENLDRAGLQVQPDGLLQQLSADDPKRASAITRAIIASRFPQLQRSILFPLSQWLQVDPDGAFKAMHGALDRGDEDTSVGIAQGYLNDWFLCSESHQTRHLEVLGRLLSSRHPGARAWALLALRHAKGEFVRAAINLLVKMDYGDDDQLLNSALGVFDRRHGIDPDQLTPEDVNAILSKIREVRQLSRQGYEIDEFLSFACEIAPKSVVQCLLARIHYCASASAELPEDYEPLPYTGFHTGLGALAKSCLFPALLRDIRNEVLRPEWQYGVWIPTLFAQAAGGFGTAALAVLQEWVESGDPEKVIGAARLLGEAGHEFAFKQHHFVADLLTRASELSPDCYDHTRSRLFGLAISGLFSGTPGQPPPRRVQDQQQATKLAQTYRERPKVCEFYKAIKEWSGREIKESLARDEELLDR